MPGTGVVLNNFLNWTDLSPDSPNALRAGERIAMCLAPSISTRNGKGVLALGTPGSYGILQTQVQALVVTSILGLMFKLPSRCRERASGTAHARTWNAVCRTAFAWNSLHAVTM